MLAALTPHAPFSSEDIHPQIAMISSLLDTLSVGEAELQNLIRAQDNRGRTVIHYLATAPCSHADIRTCIELLLQRLDSEEEGDALLLQSDAKGTRPFHLAAREGNLELLDTYHDRALSLTARDLNENTYLHIAALADQQSAVEWILDNQPVSISLPNAQGQTALHMAASACSPALCNILIRAPAAGQNRTPSDDYSTDGLRAVLYRDNSLMLPLHCAILAKLTSDKRGTSLVDTADVLETMYMLLDAADAAVAHADKLATDAPSQMMDPRSGRSGTLMSRCGRGMTAFHLGALALLTGVCKLCVTTMSELDIVVRVVDAFGRSPLHYAATGCAILRGSCASNDFPETMVAARNTARDECLEYLAGLVRKDDRFAWLAGPDAKGRTPLHWAAYHSDPTFVKFACDQFPDWLQEKDKMDWTPFLTACKFGDRRLAKDIYVRWPEASRTGTKSDIFAAHLLAQRGFDSLLKEFAKNDPALLTRLDGTGRAPLHWAAAKEQVAALRLLVPHSKDVIDRPDINGKTPLVIVLESRLRHSAMYSIIQAMLETGVNIEKAVGEGGVTPLAVAKQNGVPKELLKLLGAKETAVESEETASPQGRMRMWRRQGGRGGTRTRYARGSLRSARASGGSDASDSSSGDSSAPKGPAGMAAASAISTTAARRSSESKLDAEAE
mmetsp:Transcript_5680/g.16111  ORF Transcript_5680/g.16111 Transcript_5680/m.16111 type:complete len:671 (+) Transcript_5680:48-2060(+)